MSVYTKGDDCVDSGIINELTIHVDYSLDSLVELYGSLFVLKRSNEIDFAISTTGCAGPSSDEYDTPIGLSYIGIGDREKINVYDTFFDKERNEIRKCVTNTALYLALKNINQL